MNSVLFFLLWFLFTFWFLLLLPQGILFSTSSLDFSSYSVFSYSSLKALCPLLPPLISLRILFSLSLNSRHSVLWFLCEEFCVVCIHIALYFLFLLPPLLIYLNTGILFPIPPLWISLHFLFPLTTLWLSLKIMLPLPLHFWFRFSLPPCFSPSFITLSPLLTYPLLFMVIIPIYSPFLKGVYSRKNLWDYRCFKGTVARDFLPLVFFINQSHLGHW
jgi:hypothetical protein